MCLEDFAASCAASRTMGPPHPSRRAPRDDCVFCQRTDTRPPQDEAEQRSASVLSIPFQSGTLWERFPIASRQSLHPLPFSLHSSQRSAARMFCGAGSAVTLGKKPSPPCEGERSAETALGACEAPLRALRTPGRV